MKAPIRAPAGPLRRMVARECDQLAHQYACFREAWDRRDMGSAVIQFERFCDLQLVHMKWEEDTLLKEFERHCRSDERDEIRRHRKQHHLSAVLAERVMRLLARRMGLGALVDDELLFALDELEQVACSHRQSELDEVCARLDAVLSDVELRQFEADGTFPTH